MKSDIVKILPARFSVSLLDGEMAGWRWVNKQAPPLLFCHATGFCASAYKQMLQHLAGTFDIYALDMRGHGKTSLPADPARLRSWNVYADDIAAFLDMQHRDGWTIAGHSMGGVTAAIAARGRSDIASLRLIEPVMMPTLITLAAHMPFWNRFSRHIPIVKGAAKRRSTWENRDQVLKSYGRKALFSPWADGILGDYLEDGLKPAENTPKNDKGAVLLACDPQWEAATFAAHANDFWGALKGACVPIALLAANPSASTISKRARLRCKRLGVGVRELAGLTHLAPMIDPAQCAEFIARDT